MDQMTVLCQPHIRAASMPQRLLEQEVEVLATGNDYNWTTDSLQLTEMEPMLTQLGLGVTTTTVTTITQTGGDWTTGLFDVCGDRTTCVLGSLLPCCLDLRLAHDLGEDMCLPLLPGSTFALRVGFRERYKIRGSVCDDWATVCCCYPLAVCQMMREMKSRMRSQTYQVSTTLECS